MSSRLVGLVKRTKFGKRRAERKLACMAFADSANDAGEGVECDLEAIMESAEVNERTAITIRGELKRVGLLDELHAGGRGPHDKSLFRLNVGCLQALFAGDVTYDELLARAAKKGASAAPSMGATDAPLEDASAAPLRVHGVHPSAQERPNKGATTGAAKGATPPPLSPPLNFPSPPHPLSPSLSPPHTPPGARDARGRVCVSDQSAIEKLRTEGDALHVV